MTARSVQLEAAMQALRNIADPCSLAMGRPVDIVSLGLVEKLDIDGTTAHVELVLTQPACLFFMDISAYVTAKLKEVDGIDDVTIQVSDTVMWTPDRQRRTAVLPP